jgi:3',5'-cyclic AMP phosphodiesterase CpdA
MIQEPLKRRDQMQDRITYDPTNDGIDRRGFLKCMAWTGTGLAWTVTAGILGCNPLSKGGGQPATDTDQPAKGDFTFVQVSDSHIGFGKDPNKDVTKTFQEAVARINAMPHRPAFLLHTGDLTHLAKPAEFETVAEVLKGAKTDQAFFVPGEHDVFTDDGRSYLERYGKGTRGTGWRSFDYDGVHFVGLINVMNLKAGGLGVLGTEQLDWLKKDVASLGDSTPVVVYAHVPLWTVYPKWGWGTEDSAKALAHLRRFGSVTVLNGHIHQILRKVEGNVTFHTACSTAFPQPEPGKAASPGPVKNVPAEKLRSLLGLTSVRYTEGKHLLATTDTSLE